MSSIRGEGDRSSSIVELHKNTKLKGEAAEQVAKHERRNSTQNSEMYHRSPCVLDGMQMEKPAEEKRTKTGKRIKNILYVRSIGY